MDKKILLSTRDLCKTYYSEGEGVHVIRNVNLEVYKGDFTVIMGSSGCGKSTLLYLLSGLDQVTSGEIWFKNERFDNLKEKQMVDFRRENMGFTFQGINLVPYLSLIENSIVTGRLIEKNKNKVVKRAKELFELFGISKEENRLPAQVSGGQQQRAAIARALINQCEVVFADEPTGSLNSSQGENVLDIFTDINKNGQSIIMVTHDLKAACRGDRILYMKDGKIEGELHLSKITDQNTEDREQRVYSFLKERGW